MPLRTAFIMVLAPAVQAWLIVAVDNIVPELSSSEIMKVSLPGGTENVWLQLPLQGKVIGIVPLTVIAINAVEADTYSGWRRLDWRLPPLPDFTVNVAVVPTGVIGDE